MMKRLIAMLLVLVMVFAMMPVVLADTGDTFGKGHGRTIEIKAEFYDKGQKVCKDEKLTWAWGDTELYVTRTLENTKWATFLGWSVDPKDDDGSNHFAVTEKILKDGKVKLHAIWGAKKTAVPLKITYHSNYFYFDEKVVDTTSYPDLRTVEQVQLKKPSQLWTKYPFVFEFKGWASTKYSFTADVGFYVDEVDELMETGELELWAVWGKQEQPEEPQKIVYHVGYGEEKLNPAVEKKVSGKGPFTLDKTAPKSWNVKDCKFVGWTTNIMTCEIVKSVKASDFDDNGVCDVFGVWEEKHPEEDKTVTYEMNGTYYTYTPKAKELDRWGNLVLPTPAKLGFKDPSGKEFSHWYFENDKSQKYYAGSTIPYEAKFMGHTLHAVYTGTPVCDGVTFHANNGSNDTRSCTLKSLKVSYKGYQLPTAKELGFESYWDTRTCKWVYVNDNFVCWNTKKNGNGKDYYANEYYSSLPDTLYAVWDTTHISTLLPFTDVAPSSWYYNAIADVYQKGLMDGVTATKFAPNGYLDRGMLVTILWRYAGRKSVSATNPFRDVASNFYYTEAINWAYLNNVVTGMSAVTFAPTQYITREQLATILWRYFGSPKSTQSLSMFIDAGAVRGYAIEAVRWAVENGYLAGTANYLHPGDFATRAEVAAIFSRLK